MTIACTARGLGLVRGLLGGNCCTSAAHAQALDRSSPLRVSLSTDLATSSRGTRQAPFPPCPQTRRGGLPSLTELLLSSFYFLPLLSSPQIGLDLSCGMTPGQSRQRVTQATCKGVTHAPCLASVSLASPGCSRRGRPIINAYSRDDG